MLGAAGIAGFAALVWWAFDFAEVNTQARLPSDLALATPAAGVPSEIAAFAGVWGGDRWDGVLPHTLAVERVAADGSADVVYALGMDRLAQSPQTAIRLKGRISGQHLRVMLPNGNVLDYRPDATGGLLGSNTAPSGWRSLILLRRLTAPDIPSIIRAADTRASPLWEEIGIPERASVGDAAGERLTLKATLYRTRLAGRQPLIVINHGSAADSSIGRVLHFEAQARFFLSLGYSVLIPMRKGRGGSGGPLLEREDLSAAPDIEIDSAIEDIDAAVEQMRAEPFVDPRRIVIAGEQRGGLLSLVYATRHPDKTAAVIDFSGGWWPPNSHAPNVDLAKFLAPAKLAGGPPVLRLYADGDPFTPLGEARREFAEFQSAGGAGRLVLLAGNGYANHVFSWTAKWQQPVRDFLTRDDRPRAGVGVSLVNLRDPIDNGVLQAAIFYPAEAGDEATVAGVWTVDALRDAPPSPGKFPVLLVSHDGGGNRMVHHDLATSLARQGFVTIAVTHAGDRLAESDDWQTERVMIGREYELRAALDQVLAMPVLGPHLDANRVGVIGIGFGAYTALLLAGAKPDLTQLLPPEKRPHHLQVFRDVRIKAALLLAPGPGDLFDAAALSALSLPIEIYAAGDDEIFPPRANSEKLRSLLPTAPEYRTADGANHYAFIAPCSEIQRKAAPELCTGAPGFDRVAFHARLAASAARFFDQSLASR